MKKNVIRIITLLVAALIPIVSLISRTTDEKTDAQTQKAETSVLKKLAGIKVSAVEKMIEEKEAQKQEQIYQKQLLAERISNENKLREQLKKGETTFRTIFRDTFIVGDSIMNGLEVYDILDSSNMLTKVGASLTHLSDSIDTIINNAPKVLILHYGVNMIDTQDYFIDNFISTYTSCINRIREGTPDTKIVVSGIIPVSSKGIANEPVLANCPKYEKRIARMCSDIGVIYLDNTGIISDGSDYYDLDGVHVKRSFYTDVWLVYVATELGL